MSLKDGAINAVYTCMGVSHKDRVTIITDSHKYSIGSALYDVSKEVTPYTCLVLMPDLEEENREPPKQVAEAMKHSTVIFIVTEKTMTHTTARLNANHNGARVASMPGINEYIFSRGGMTADYTEIQKIIKKVHRKLRSAKTLHISSEIGTNLELSIKGRHWITEDDGICHANGGFTNLPAGTIFIAPVENNANGVVYFDGGLEGDIKKPVRLQINNSSIVRMPKYAKIERFIGTATSCAFKLSQFGMGLNPRAKVIGNILQDEKAWGTIHIGFGENYSFGGKIKCSTHFEGVIKEPTLEVDGHLIIEKGNFLIL